MTPRQIGRRQGPPSRTTIIRDLERAAYIEVERTADGTGWLATIDDSTGDRADTIDAAIRNAWYAWRLSNV